MNGCLLKGNDVVDLLIPKSLSLRYPVFPGVAQIKNILNRLCLVIPIACTLLLLFVTLGNYLNYVNFLIGDLFFVTFMLPVAGKKILKLMIVFVRNHSLTWKLTST